MYSHWPPVIHTARNITGCAIITGKVYTVSLGTDQYCAVHLGILGMFTGIGFLASDSGR